MNQQQRAGKHPSFSRGNKPLGRKPETFHQSFNGLPEKQYHSRSKLGVTRAYRQRRVYNGLLDTVFTVVTAIVNRDWDTLEGLVRRGDSPAAVLARCRLSLDQQNQKGYTLLYDAIQSGRGTMVKLLIQAGAKPDVENKDGDTPLHLVMKQWLCGMSHGETMVTLLINAGAKLDVKNKHGNTPLHLAFSRSQLYDKSPGDREKMVKLLIQAGANPDMKNKDGDTPLHLAFNRNWLCNLSPADIKMIVELLIQAGAKLDVKNKYGDTPLHVAVSRNGIVDPSLEFSEMVELLLQAEAIPDVENIVGDTPVHLLAAHSMVTLLINAGAKVDVENEAGNTPLHLAMNGSQFWRLPSGCKKVLVDLIQAGANPDVKNKAGDTPLHLAVRTKRWNIVKLMLQHSLTSGTMASRRNRNRTTLLHDVISQGQREILQTLLQMNAVPLVTDSRGNSLMMAAVNALYDQENLLRALIRSGISTHQPSMSHSRIHSSYVGQFRTSPMWTAASAGQLRLVRLLYASGACSQQEVYHTRRLFYGPARMPTDIEQVHRFLDEVSSRPRSLRDLCALTVSHYLGCGPDRGQRAAGAGLPPALCRLVLHDHVVDPDFLEDGWSPDLDVIPIGLDNWFINQ